MTVIFVGFIVRFAGSQYHGDGFDNLTPLRSLHDVEKLLRSVAESKLCVSTARLWSKCDLICETPRKIYCNSCVQEHLQSTRKNKYAEKTKAIKEKQTRQKY